jgi:hypothetical protein
LIWMFSNRKRKRYRSYYCWNEWCKIKNWKRKTSMCMCILEMGMVSILWCTVTHGTVKRLMTQLEIALGQNYTEAKRLLIPPSSQKRNN